MMVVVVVDLLAAGCWLIDWWGRVTVVCHPAVNMSIADNSGDTSTSAQA